MLGQLNLEKKRKADRMKKYSFQLTQEELQHILRSLCREAPAEPILYFGDWLPRKSRAGAVSQKDTALRENLLKQAESFLEEKDIEFEVGGLVSVKMLPLKGKEFEVQSRHWAADIEQYEYVICSHDSRRVMRSAWLEKL